MKRRGGEPLKSEAPAANTPRGSRSPNFRSLRVTGSIVHFTEEVLARLRRAFLSPWASRNPAFLLGNLNFPLASSVQNRGRRVGSNRSHGSLQFLRLPRGVILDFTTRVNKSSPNQQVTPLPPLAKKNPQQFQSQNYVPASPAQIPSDTNFERCSG